jgi:O-antigen/teichoic acid export membrane protein
MNIYSRGNARKALIDTVTFRSIAQVFTVFGYIVLIRGIPEEDFGVYSLLYAIIPLVSLVASLGLTQVLRRYEPEYLQAGNVAAAAWLVRIVSSSRLIANLIVIAVILLAWNYIAPIVKLTPYRTEFLAFNVILLLSFQVSILQIALQSHMLQRYAIGSGILLSLVKLIFYSVFSFYDRLSLETAILTDSLAFAAAYIVMRAAYRKKCLTKKTRTKYRPDKKERKRLVRYGLFNNFNDAGVLLMYSTLDNFFIAAYIGTVAVGIYAFYSRLRNLVTAVLPARFFQNVIRPMLFAIPSAEAHDKLPRYFSFLLNINLMIYWPAFVFSLAYHAEIVQVVFGGKFIEHSWLFPLIMFFGLLNTVSNPGTLVAQYEERADIILYSKLFAIYNIGAMIVLIPQMGIYGAALAGGTAQTMKNLFIWWHVRKRAQWINGRAALTIGFGLWGGCVAVLFGLKAVLVLPAVVDILVGVIVVGCFGLLHIRSEAVSSSDRRVLAAVTPDRAVGLLQKMGLLTQTGAKL